MGISERRANKLIGRRLFCGVEILVRGILAKEAVEVATVEEQGQVVVSVFWPVAARVIGVPGTSTSRTEPSRAAVGDLWIKICVEERILSRHARSKPTVDVSLESAISNPPVSNQTLVGANVTGDPILVSWGFHWKREYRSRLGVRASNNRS